MIIVKKSGYLEFKKLKLRCSLGKAGIKKKIKEGDNITPRGVFKIIKLYYRADKIEKIQTQIRKIKNKKKIGWCDDPRSVFYNKQIKLPNKFSHEKLYRNDNLYDFILVLNYNMNPIVKNKGSAIFIHVAKNNYQPTHGCIGLKKIDLLTILKKIKKNEKVKII